MKRLNGWQRLWIVTTVTLGILVAYNATDTFPSQTNISERYQGQRDFWEACLPYKEAEAIRPHTIKQPGCDSITANQIDSLSKNLWIEEQSALADMPQFQLMFVANKGAWWLGISIGLYVLGLVVRWIRQGFRPNRDVPA